jgi:uncharacterized iron-regulated membrane protein
MMEVLIAAAGCLATIMVIVGMILITPRGTESAPARPSPNGAHPDMTGATATAEERTAPPVG